MKQLAKIHKWVALGFSLFWIVQAISGALLIFQRELDDFSVPFSLREKEASDTLKGLSTGLERLRQTNPDHKPLFLLNRGSRHNLLDIVTETQKGEHIVYRLSATNGALHKTYYWDGPVTKLDFFRALHLFHTRLLSGTIGNWIIGLSGFFLATTLILGLYIGWPRNGTIRQALRPKPFQIKIPNLYTWHRAMGLWCAFILLFITVSGTMLIWQTPLRHAMGALHNPPPTAQEALKTKDSPISLLDAIGISKQHFPNAKLALVSFPKKATPYYQVRLTQPDENRMVYGTTTVYVSPQDGQILRIYNPLTTTSFKLKAFDALYALHTGEIWGLPGRLLNLAAAFGLIALSCLGGLLYYKKKTRPKRH